MTDRLDETNGRGPQPRQLGDIELAEFRRQVEKCTRPNRADLFAVDADVIRALLARLDAAERNVFEYQNREMNR